MAVLRRKILSSQIQSAASSGTVVKGIANTQVLSGKLIRPENIVGGKLVAPVNVQLGKEGFTVTFKTMNLPKGFEYYANPKVDTAFNASKLKSLAGKAVLQSPGLTSSNFNKISYKFI